MSESNFAKQALPEWQKEHPGARVMRNNIGMAYQGKLIVTAINGIIKKILKNLRPISFGIGLPTKDKLGYVKQKGGGDYIGWESKTICEILGEERFDGPPFFECPKECKKCRLNEKIAIFLSLETKSKDGKESTEQIKFRKTVQAAGGIAIILKEGE